MRNMCVIGSTQTDDVMYPLIKFGLESARNQLKLLFESVSLSFSPNYNIKTGVRVPSMKFMLPILTIFDVLSVNCHVQSVGLGLDWGWFCII